MKKLLNINQLKIDVASAKNQTVQLYTIQGDILFQTEKVNADIIIDTSSYKEDIYILQIGTTFRGVHIY
ncbi:T9SS type A sorting domain-containing protein [Wenyingzhuangia sp. IMCC45574]